jgi:hypothetical protein
MYAAGFYTYSIFALMFWETRRSDFGVSMSHHVATVVLIVLSYVFRYVLILDNWYFYCFMNLEEILDNIAVFLISFIFTPVIIHIQSVLIRTSFPW